MQLFNRILKIRPNVNSDDFELQDNSDGKGPYISRWDSDLTQPTKEEISSVDDSKPTWIAAQEEIARLESTITPRRIREMTTADGTKWVDDVEKLIAVERAKL
jgi:hypothetical protein